MNELALPIVLPAFGAALAMLSTDNLSRQRLLGGVFVHAALGLAAWLLVKADRDTIDVLHFGDWPPGLGISFVLDRLAAIMLALAALTGVVTWWFSEAGADPPAAQRRYFQPLLLIILAGANWAFLTGDLFNLFVSFELILIASYVLLIDGDDRSTLLNSYKFLLINGVSGTLFLMAAGLIYGAFGTLNLAELAVRASAGGLDLGILFGSLLLIVFGLKAAVVPLFTWLPAAYPGAPLAALPFLTGMLTKIGVYALYRVYTLVLPEAMPPWFQPILFAAAGLTMLLGVLAALAQWSVRAILSIHIISQIGYMILGLAYHTAQGLAGGILSIAHNIIVKTSLFLVAATLVLRWGHDELGRRSGALRTQPLLGIAFLLAAASLAGLPPFSGFYSKWFLTLEGVMQQRPWITTTAVVTGLFTLASMVKIWLYVFWGEAPDSEPEAANWPAAPVRVTAALVGVSLLFVIFSGPIARYAQAAGRQLMEPARYIEAGLSGGPSPPPPVGPQNTAQRENRP